MRRILEVRWGFDGLRHGRVKKGEAQNGSPPTLSQEIAKSAGEREREMSCFVPEVGLC